ncbi:MAG: DUF2141 domain-containing protein [Litorimonas sp.]
MTTTLQKTLTLAFASGLSLFLNSVPAWANDESPVVPMTITLTDVMQSNVPLYISVQTEAEYRSMKGQGAILKETAAGTITETVQLPSGGDYAITIWHDLDNDGRFSMNERYEIADGWGTSGKVVTNSAPTFQSAKITVPNFGAETTIAMIYPKP